MNPIDIEGLHKAYGDIEVLRGLNLQVSSGTVYGLLGPNGAGKTTLLHLMLGFLKPSSGVMRILGSEDVSSVHGRIGYLPERLRYHMRFSAREYLRYLAQFDSMPARMIKTRVEEELKRVGILEIADRLLATYSKGQLQRVGIAQALLHNPELLLIDEPTSGLDPSGQYEMLALLDDLRREGHTIFLCTHYLDEVERLCDQVGVLYNGRLAVELNVGQLRVPGRSVSIGTGPLSAELIARLQRISPAVRCVGREVILRPNSMQLQATVLRILLDADVPIVSLQPQGRPLEAIYLQIVRGEEPDLSLTMPLERPDNGDPLLGELLQREEKQL